MGWKQEAMRLSWQLSNREEQLRALTATAEARQRENTDLRREIDEKDTALAKVNSECNLLQEKFSELTMRHKHILKVMRLSTNTDAQRTREFYDATDGRTNPLIFPAESHERDDS